MSDAELVQGSDAWVAARLGSLGASRLSDALAKTKSGWGASRANVMAALVAERLTGIPQDTYTNAAMAWGTEKEPDAIAAYEFYADCTVTPVGLVRHPMIMGTHASPDGLVGAHGLVEVKCPNTATHIETLLGGTVPQKYWLQMQWQLECTGRAWCDWVSFDPRMPERMRLYVKRIERDDKALSTISTDVRAFLEEVEAQVAALEAQYERQVAA
jgi:putative phage-type endonuclease